MPPSVQNEVTLLEQYNKEIESLGDRLAESDPNAAKRLQQQMDQKLQIYWKQIQLVKTQYPDTIEGRIHESAFYTFQALRKLLDAGLMRRVSSRSGNMAWGIATGLVAKQQEKGNAHQALTILNQALAVFDYPGAHLQKAHIYRLLNQTGGALQELNYIITNFQDDDAYLAARQMKDEIENPPKKGMCFVATAAYGTPLAPEVIAFCRFRDEVLLLSRIGQLFVNLYYFASPSCARFIGGSPLRRAVIRLLLLQPLLSLVKKIKID